MKGLIVLALFYVGSASAASVCHLTRASSTAFSQVVLVCSDKKEPQVFGSRKYAGGDVKAKHLKLKLDMMEKLVEQGYTIVSDKLFVKY